MILRIGVRHITMIFKMSLKIIVSLVCLSLALRANALDINSYATNTLKSGKIHKDAQSQVIELESFVIAFVALTNPLQDREAKLAHKGELYAKLAIFEHYKRNDENLKGLIISKALRSNIIKHGDKLYLALAINRANITKSYNESSAQDTREIYKQKAQMLESNQSNDIATLKELARIYHALGEIEKYNETQDKILQKEFEW